MRKVTSLFLALLLVLALTPAFAESANLSEPGVLPIWTGDEPYTLTVLIPQRPEVADYKDNDLTRWVEKSCNVNLEFEYLPSDDANQKLAIMINSGDKLPDIICTGNISVSDAYNYGQAGALLDVSDYYKNGLAVNADKAVADHPDWNLITNITCYDGSIYGVPRIQASPPTRPSTSCGSTRPGWTSWAWNSLPPPRNSRRCSSVSVTRIPTATARRTSFPCSAPLPGAAAR